MLQWKGGGVYFQTFTKRVFGRNVPRKPRLAGGVKGHNMKRNYLTGKPWPVAQELQMIYGFGTFFMQLQRRVENLTIV
jgi:hypothetical protein